GAARRYHCASNVVLPEPIGAVRSTSLRRNTLSRRVSSARRSMHAAARSGGFSLELMRCCGPIALAPAAERVRSCGGSMAPSPAPSPASRLCTVDPLKARAPLPSEGPTDYAHRHLQRHPLLSPAGNAQQAIHRVMHLQWAPGT